MTDRHTIDKLQQRITRLQTEGSQLRVELDIATGTVVTDGQQVPVFRVIRPPEPCDHGFPNPADFPHRTLILCQKCWEWEWRSTRLGSPSWCPVEFWHWRLRKTLRIEDP